MQTIMCRTCDGDGTKDGAICPVCKGSTIERVRMAAPPPDDEETVRPLRAKKKKKRRIA